MHLLFVAMNEWNVLEQQLYEIIIIHKHRPKPKHIESYLKLFLSCFDNLFSTLLLKLFDNKDKERKRERYFVVMKNNWLIMDNACGHRKIDSYIYT